MRIIASVLVVMLAAVTFAPVASAGPIFCPPYNPYAVANMCIAGNTITAPLYHPAVGGPTNYCIIGSYCVSLPSTYTTSTNVPDFTLCGTYVWVLGTYVLRPMPCTGVTTSLANSFTMSADIALLA